MIRLFLGSVAVAVAGLAPMTLVSRTSTPRTASDFVVAPRATLDTNAQTAAAKPGRLDTAVFAGGCFWGVEAVFEHVRGVTNVISGYAGGDAKTATYDLVSSGSTDHAEAVRVIYDPAKISYGNLLRILFSIAHDPTQLNRQGPDIGTQYRSAIFYTNKEQEKAAKAYIKQVDDSKVLKKPIVTTVNALEKFYPAEEYHQDFMERHPNHPYIVQHDRPKVEALKKNLPDVYREGGRTGK